MVVCPALNVIEKQDFSCLPITSWCFFAPPWFFLSFLQSFSNNLCCDILEMFAAKPGWHPCNQENLDLLKTMLIRVIFTGSTSHDSLPFSPATRRLFFKEISYQHIVIMCNNHCSIFDDFTTSILKITSSTFYCGDIKRKACPYNERGYM